jgi:hypothetical protein
MSTAGEAQPSRGRPCARGAAEARRARPSAWPEPDAQGWHQAAWGNEGEPKGAAPRGMREADAPAPWFALQVQGGRE